MESTISHLVWMLHTVFTQTTFSSSGAGFKLSPEVRKAEIDCCATSYGTCSPTFWNLVTGPSKYQDYISFSFDRGMRHIAHAYFEKDCPPLHLVERVTAVPRSRQSTSELRHGVVVGSRRISNRYSWGVESRWNNTVIFISPDCISLALINEHVSTGGTVLFAKPCKSLEGSGVSFPKRVKESRN